MEEKFIGRKVEVKLKNGEKISGILLAIDTSMHGGYGNVVLKLSSEQTIIIRASIWEAICLK